MVTRKTSAYFINFVDIVSDIKTDVTPSYVTKFDLKA